MERECILVTAALPYANGPVHIGHAIGAYIPADVYTRYHRLKGSDVIYICGTDEYGTPIAVTADNEGITPKEVVDKYYESIKDAFQKLDIEFDNFSRTSKKLHIKNSQEFFLRVKENGHIYKKTVERPYCNNCNRYLPDRYVKGVCPYCGSEDERGDQCEACGKQLEPNELRNPYCVVCRKTPQMKETEHWFFKLSEFQDRLKDWISEQKHWPDNARNFALSWISEGLEDRAITRDLRWGVPVPGEKNKVLYVWFDAPIGYISSTMEWSEDKWEKYWKKDCKIVHFIGKDNIPFHAIIWPAMLLAHGNYNLPWQISSNEYLTLEGRKMSTSRGWVIWLHDILEEFDPDLIRYYLISINPSRHDADFSLAEFQNGVNNELIATLGNFINRTLVFIQKNSSGKIPEPGKYDPEDKNFIEAIQRFSKEVGQEIENFHFKEALSSLMDLARRGNEYFQHKEPWKKDSPAALYLCANAIRSLAILMHPFMPLSAQKTWKMLNLEGGVEEQNWSSAEKLGIKPEHKLGEVKPLYTKIEDDEIKKFEEKFLTRKVKKMVKFDEFQQIDFRVGEIKEVKDHPKAENLYLLKVDLGEIGERQLVAGIRSSYSKEELLGKKIIVVVNLEPRELRGEKSEGMLLAADLDGKPVLLSPDKDVKPGTEVK